MAGSYFRQARVVIGLCDTVGTIPATPVGILIEKASYKPPGGARETVSDSVIRSDGNPPRAVKGLGFGAGTIRVPFTTQYWGLFAYLFLGGYSHAAYSSGASQGPYEHLSTIDVTVAPRVVWVEIGSTVSGKYDRFNSAIITSLSLGSVRKVSEQLFFDVELMGTGQYTLNQSSALDAAVTEYDLNIHSKVDSRVMIDGSAQPLITEFSYTIRREGIRLDGLDGNYYASGLDVGNYSIDCKMKGWRDASDTIRGLDNDAEHTVEFQTARTSGVYTDSGFWAGLDHDEVLIFNDDPEAVSDGNPVEYSVTVKPHAEGEVSAVEWTTRNAIEDYAAIL